MKALSESVVLVTGAGRGVGRAIALEFARRGARIAAQDVSPVNLDETLQLVEQEGATGLECVVDMSKKMQVQGMIEAGRESLGEIDVLINQGTVAPAVDLLDMDEWDWDRTMGINLKGYFLAAQSMGRLMRDRGEGTMINIVVPPTRFLETERHPAYEISAAGIRELTRQIASELAGSSVHVFAVEVLRNIMSAADQGPGSEVSGNAWWQRDPGIIASAVVDLAARADQLAPGSAILVDETGLVEKR